MTPVTSPRPSSGFSLIEVVIATAVFATAIVAIIGLMSPLSHRVEDVIDSEIASRLAESIQTELDRIGFTTAVNITSSGNLELVANERGDRVRLAVWSSGTPAADNALNSTTLPGIAQRDRYFYITLSQQVVYSSSNSGSLALRADVQWPYHLPVGPATSGETDPTADPFTTTTAISRQSLPFFFALTP